MKEKDKKNFTFAELKEIAGIKKHICNLNKEEVGKAMDALNVARKGVAFGSEISVKFKNAMLDLMDRRVEIARKSLECSGTPISAGRIKSSKVFWYGNCESAV